MMNASSTSENAFLLLVPEGSELVATFDWSWVIAGFFFSSVSALAGVNAVEAFRSESDAFKKQLDVLLFSLCVGGGGIWWLHFTGQYALDLHAVVDGVSHSVSQRYDPVPTVVSFFLALIFVHLGAMIASKDAFFGTSRKQATNKLQELVSLKVIVKYGKRVKLIVLFTNPQRFIAGGGVTGAGVLAMHYMGMSAVVANGFVIEWNVPVLAVSFVLALVVPVVGFWIIFRLLQWRPNSELLRVGSAPVIAVAVCAVHYSGMAASHFVVAHATLLDAEEATQPTKEDVFIIGVCINVSLLLSSQMYLLIDSRRRARSEASQITAEVVAAVETQLKKATNLDDAIHRFQQKIQRVLVKEDVSTRVGSGVSRSLGGRISAAIHPLGGGSEASALSSFADEGGEE